MAKAAGVSRSTVQRIWDAHGLQPHRVTTFKLSKAPAFVQKLTDIVGLYLNPPDQAVVLCVDEKSQIHADGSLAAQPRRELVQPADATTASPRRLLQRAGTRGFGGFPKKLARTSPRCGGDPVGDHKPSLIRSRAGWPQFLPRQARLSPRTVSKDLWARSLRPRVRQLRQASLQRA